MGIAYSKSGENEMQRISNLPTGPEDELLHRGARRRTARYMLHGEVTVTAPIEAQGFVFNVSAGGMRIALDAAVEVGSILELTVRLTDDAHSVETGEVVWCRELPDGWLLGIRFIEAAELPN